MISLTFSLTFRRAGMSAQRAPAIMAANIITGIIAQAGPSQPVRMTHVVAKAPM
jgi:hypothetical protein